MRELIDSSVPDMILINRLQRYDDSLCVKQENELEAGSAV